MGVVVKLIAKIEEEKDILEKVILRPSTSGRVL